MGSKPVVITVLSLIILFFLILFVTRNDDADVSGVSSNQATQAASHFVTP